MNAITFPDESMGADYVVTDIPAELVEKAKEYREVMIEAISEFDDSIMEKFLGGEEVTNEEIVSAIRKGTLACKLIPVVGGSSFKNKGVQSMLDAVIAYLPSPVDIPAVKGTDMKTGEEMTRRVADDEKFSSLAFKIMTDPFVGRLTFFRVYSGHLEKGSYVLNSTKDKKERLGRILQMHANKREEIAEVYTGDIAAAVGLKDTTTGDTLCDEAFPIVLERMEFPEPVIHIAVEPKTKADQEKMGIALQKLAEEDPTFKVRTDEETGQTIIGGMGELHLEILVDRMKREFNVEANVGKPQVAYRETINGNAKQETKYIKQTGGKGQYGHVWLTVEPLERGKGIEFVNAVVGGVVPREYVPAVEKGVREAIEGGVLAGYQLQDIKVALIDGSYHEVDSSEMAFKIAGSMCLKAACKAAQPVLLEPIFFVEVTTPEEYMGDIIGDLNSRRGVIQGMTDKNNAKIVEALVPLSEMFGYATDIRSKSQGRATYSMEFKKYEEVPANIAKAIIAERGK